jgi:DNA-binding CsgD family transcriptional regulator
MHFEREQEESFAERNRSSLFANASMPYTKARFGPNSSQLRSVLDAFASTAPLHVTNSQGRVLLTKRETDVVKLVVDGQSNREVAEKLGITEHTVSNYLFRIYEKLGISSRVELVLYSLR